MTLSVAIETWPIREPFRITGHEWTTVEVVVATWREAGVSGRGEACGVYYRGETAETLKAQIQAAAPDLREGLSRHELLRLLPAGGARNAIDCALWERDARLLGLPAWEVAGVLPPKALLTTFTLGVDTPEAMAAKALGYAQARAIKLKLNGDGDAERVRAVRQARPDVWLGVDANQGFTRASLEALLPTLEEAEVRLIEQPLPIGQDADLKGLQSPIPLAADESFQDLEDLAKLVGLYDVVNIKLDKCGGLTRGLQIAAAARDLGLQVMVGNMLGTSMAMAPAYILGQFCDVVDLDGPIPLLKDRTPSVIYQDGYIHCDDGVWASGAALFAEGAA